MVNLTEKSYPFELGLIGYPLGHSYSARYFNDKFSRENISGSYRLFPLENLNSFEELLSENKDLIGLNVTIPYKETIIPHLDSLSNEAASIGAVNTIKIKRTKDKINTIGYNTDWSGFIASLPPRVITEVKAALVLGSGGASKAVTYALEKIGIAVTVVSRTARHNAIPKQIRYDAVDSKLLASHLLIVNTTPLGMYPNVNAALPIPYQSISKNHICYDLIYNPEKTEFMKLCALRGATVINGLEMLERQADAAWNIWATNMIKS